MSTQSTDVNTTKYLYKPNVETTRYFVNDGGADIAEQVARNTANIEINSIKIDALTTVVENNTSDISDIKDRLDVDEILINDNSTNISTNTTNISTNTTDITNLKDRVSNCENNISTNTTNISNLQSQISNLNLGSPYEGYYYSLYNDTTHPVIQFNYNKGRMIYWSDSSRYKSAVNDVGENCINTSVKELTLPGNIKLLNSDNTVNQYMSDIIYY